MLPKKSIPLYILLVTFVLAIGWMQTLAPAADTEAELPPPGADFLLMARHAVGARELLIGDDAASLREMQLTLEPFAEHPAQEVRLVMVTGELLGGTKARARLKKLSTDETFSKYSEDLESLERIYGDGLELSDAEKATLVERHGWFAQLALSYGLEDGKRERRAALRPAIRAEITYLAMFILLSLALMGGAGLLVMGSMALVKGNISLAYPKLLSPPPEQTAFLEVMVLTLAAMPALGFLAAIGPPALAPLLQAFPLLLVFWLFLRGVPRKEAFAGLGWTRGNGVFKEVFCGFVGYLAGIPILGLGLVLTIVLVQFSGDAAAHPIAEHFQGASVLKIAFLYFVACVGAPVVEESMFRGAFYHHLRRSHGFLVSGLLQGLVFAAIHPQGWAGVPILTAIGFVMAGIREWRGSIIAPIVAHSINNGMAITAMMLILM